MGMRQLFGGGTRELALPTHMVTSAPSLPGWIISKHLAIVGSSRNIKVGLLDPRKDAGQVYEEVMLEMCESAKDLGANAILNVRLAPMPIGAGFIVSSLLVTGDAVIAVEADQ